VEHENKNSVRALDQAIGRRNIAVVMAFLQKGAKLGNAPFSTIFTSSKAVMSDFNSCVCYKPYEYFLDIHTPEIKVFSKFIYIRL